jgi:transcriptional regulator with XRE-family HTH domain
MSTRHRIFAGAHLRSLRERHNLRQVELAQKLGVSPSYLSQLSMTTAR